MLRAILLMISMMGAANAEPLKLFTDFEYQSSLSGSSTINPNVEGQSFEAALGLKYKVKPWMQVQTGFRYYEESQNLYGMDSEYDLTGYFIKLQTIHVIWDF